MANTFLPTTGGLDPQRKASTLGSSQPKAIAPINSFLGDLNSGGSIPQQDLERPVFELAFGFIP